MSEDYLHMVVHAEAKAGKTWLGTSGPGTTLVLDAEAGGMRFVPGKKVVWNVDRGEEMPEPGDWRICQVPVTDMQTLNRVRDFLVVYPDHPFNNITMDSLTEMQDNVKREISPTFQLEQRDWGRVFGMMNDITVTFRDLVALHPQLRSLVVITGTTFKDGIWRPMINGQFGAKLPYKLDAVGYLQKVRDDEGNVRRALLFDSAEHEVGHRLGDNLPSVIWDPTITQVLNTVFDTNYEEVR